MATALALTPDQLVAELKALWQQLGAGRRSYTSTAQRPIAGSAEDQPIPEGVANPLWEVARWLPASPPCFGEGRLEPDAFPSSLGALSRIEEIGAYRNALATRYAWSIITPGDVAWIVGQLDGRGVVEVGAGTGYWAWQLEQAGVDVAAYDPNPPGEGNAYCKHGPYTVVLPDDASAAARHPERALLMVWPPYGGGHARHALSVYRGDLLLYAGEGWGGCTADDEFYELLDTEWQRAGESPAHVTWSGIHCSLAAYRRK